MEIKNKPAFFAVTALLFLVLQLSLLKTFPLTDEVQFLTMARSILSGKALYRDIADVHTPGVTYLIAVVFRVFGESYFAARAMMVLVSVATAFLLYFIGRRVFSERAGIAAYLVFGVYAPVLHNFLIFTQPFIAILTALTILLFLDYFETENKGKLFLAGILLGIAWLFRQTAFWSMLGFFLALGMFWKFKPKKDHVVFVVGWVLPIFVYLAYLFTQGALPDFVDNIFGPDYAHYARITLARYPIFSLNVQAVSALSYLFFFVFAVKFFAGCRRAGNPNPAHFLLIALGTFSLPYIWPNFGYPIFIPVLVPGALCAGWFFSQEKWRNWAIVAAVAILAVSAYFYAHRSFRDEFSGNNEFGNYNFYEIPDYIRSHTQPGDTIYGFAGVVNYFLTGRNPAAKHWYLLPYATNRAREERTINDLELNGPKYVAYIPNYVLEGENVRDFAPVVNDYILKNYKTEKEFQTPWGTVWLMVPKSESTS